MAPVGTDRLPGLIGTVPLPVAQTLRRARNSESPAAAFGNAMRCLECAIKLATLARLGLWRVSGTPEAGRLGSLLERLLNASAGDWVELHRTLGRVLKQSGHADHPLVVVHKRRRASVDQWTTRALTENFGREQAAREAQQGTVEGIASFFVAYRNDTIGHGGQPPERYCEDAAEDLLAVLVDLLDEQVLYGGAELAVRHRRQDEQPGRRWTLLHGLAGVRARPCDDAVPCNEPFFISEGVHLPVHPLVRYVAGNELGHEALGFLNRTRTQGRKIAAEYLDYRSSTRLDIADAGVDLLAFLEAHVYGSRRDGRGPGKEPVGNLPEALSRCLGREEEIRELGEILASDARLVALTGPAGIGKTHVALELARRWQDHRCPSGGTWFVDASSVTSLGGLLHAIGSALGTQLIDSAAPSGAQQKLSKVIQALGQHLAGMGEVLLVLDNLEQIVDVAAVPLGQLLQEAGGLKILATTRERLHVRGETVFDLRRLARDPAVELFIERVRMVNPGIEVGSSERSSIERIVQRLDGLPLAIELAAARARGLRPADVLARLDDLFQFLRSRRRDADRRHASLRDALEWSWRLLEPWEQAALTQLSVFRSGFFLDAAQAVVDMGEHQDMYDVAEVIESLQDKSLVYDDAEGSSRFDQYSSIRAFCQDKLMDSGEGVQVWSRHRDHYLAALEPQVGRLQGPGGGSALAVLALERDNLEAIWERFQPIDPEAAVRALLCTLPLLERGPVDVRCSELSKAVDLLPSLSPALASRVLLAWGVALSASGEGAAAEETLERAATLAGQHNLVAHQARAMDQLGRVQKELGKMEHSEASLERAIELARQINDVPTLANAISNLGNLARVRHDHMAAELHLTEAARLARQCGDRLLRARVEHNLGTVLMETQRLEDAERHYNEAIRLYRDVGETRHLLGVLMNRANECTERQRYELADAHFREALELARSVHDEEQASRVLTNMGMSHLDQGRPEEARSELRLAADFFSRPGASAWWRGLAHLNQGLSAHIDGDPSRAVELYENSKASFDAANLGWACGYPLFRMGAALADMGCIEEAAAAFDGAETRLDDPTFLISLHVGRAHLDVAKGHPNAARARIDDGRRHQTDGVPSHTLSGDLRLALLLAERAVEAARA